MPAAPLVKLSVALPPQVMIFVGPGAAAAKGFFNLLKLFQEFFLTKAGAFSHGVIMETGLMAGLFDALHYVRCITRRDVHPGAVDFGLGEDFQQA